MSLIKSDKFEGSALECARGIHGFDLENISDMTGIERCRLARIENGAEYPENAEIVALAKATQVKPKFFFIRPG